MRFATLFLILVSALAKREIADDSKQERFSPEEDPINSAKADVQARPPRKDSESHTDVPEDGLEDATSLIASNKASDIPVGRKATILHANKHKDLKDTAHWRHLSFEEAKKASNKGYPFFAFKMKPALALNFLPLDYQKNLPQKDTYDHSSMMLATILDKYIDAGFDKSCGDRCEKSMAVSLSSVNEDCDTRQSQCPGGNNQLKYPHKQFKNTAFTRRCGPRDQRMVLEKKSVAPHGKNEEVSIGFRLPHLSDNKCDTTKFALGIEDGKPYAKFPAVDVGGITTFKTSIAEGAKLADQLSVQEPVEFEGETDVAKWKVRNKKNLTSLAQVVLKRWLSKERGLAERKLDRAWLSNLKEWLLEAIRAAKFWKGVTESAVDLLSLDINLKKSKVTLIPFAEDYTKFSNPSPLALIHSSDVANFLGGPKEPQYFTTYSAKSDLKAADEDTENLFLSLFSMGSKKLRAMCNINKLNIEEEMYVPVDAVACSSTSPPNKECKETPGEPFNFTFADEQTEVNGKKKLKDPSNLLKALWAKYNFDRQTLRSKAKSGGKGGGTSKGGTSEGGTSEGGTSDGAGEGTAKKADSKSKAKTCTQMVFMFLLVAVGYLSL